MPINQIKKYPELLEILHLLPSERLISLRKVFNRDIENNPDFRFRGTQIYPIKTDGAPDMDREFMHLTTERIEEVDEAGKIFKRNVFEPERSKRLHWINHHVHEKTPDNIVVFSVIERDELKRQDITKTYIYDKVEKYVIVLECQRDKGYYLLTAYHLDRPYAEKTLKKRMKKRLSEVQ